MQRSRRIPIPLLVAAGVPIAASGFIYGLTQSVTGAATTLAVAVALGVVTAGLALVITPASRSRARAQRPYLTPRELPSPPVFFAGRDRDLERARAMLRSERGRGRRPFVLLVDGGPGVGKTGFAVQLATALLADRPEGGAIYVSLTGARLNDDGRPNGRLRNVMRDLADSLQGPGDVIPATHPERQRVFRRLSRGRRGRHMLYLFDDARDDQIIEQIMPARADALVIVTARGVLSRLNPDQRLTLAPVAAAPAEEMLRHLLGIDRDTSPPWLATVVELAAGYPFAIHLAGRAISSQGLWMLPEVLAALPVPAPGQGAQDRMLDLSFALLDPLQQATLLSLVALPEGRTFVPWMVTAVAGLPPGRDGDGVDDRQARNICDQLADQRLLERFTSDATGVVQLRMPDRVSAYVAARASRDLTEQQRMAARDRLDAAKRDRRARDIRGRLRVAIPRMLNEGHLADAVTEARSVLTDARERAENIDAANPPSDDERRALAMLAIVLTELGALDDALEICQIDQRARQDARPAAAHQPDVVDARLLRCLGRLRRRERKVRVALAHLTQARHIAADVGDRLEEIWCLRELALAEASSPEAGDAIRRAHGYLNVAQALAAELPAEPDIADQTFMTGRILEARAIVRINAFESGRADHRALVEALQELSEAEKLLDPAFVVFRAWLEYRRAQAMFLQALDKNVGTADGRQRQLTNARQAAQRAMRIFSSRTHRYGAARCRLEVGRMLMTENDLDGALPLLEEARETFFFSGDRWIEARAAATLAQLRVRRQADADDAAAELNFAIPVLRAAGDKLMLRLARQARRRLGAVRRRERADHRRESTRGRRTGRTVAA